MIKTETTFQVLGKLLTEENILIQKQKEVDILFDQLLESITTNLYPAINQSSYENKTKLLVDIKDVLNEIEFLSSLPQLANKTIVLVTGEKRAVPTWFSKMKMEAYADFVKQNSNVPIILYNSEEEQIFSQNELGNRGELTKQDYTYSNRKLYQDNIQIQNLITAYFIGANSPYEHIVFLYIPQYASSSNPIYQTLHRMAEINVLVEPTDLQLKHFKLQENSRANYILTHKNTNIPAGVKVLIEQEHESILDELNIPLYTAAFGEALKNCFNDYFENVTEDLFVQQQLVNGLSKDLVTVSDENLEKNISEIRNKLRQQLRAEEVIHKKVVKQYEDTAKLAVQLEKLFLELTNDEERALLSSKRAQLLSAKLALLAIDTDNLKEIQQMQNKLVAWQSPYEQLVKTYKEFIRKNAGTTILSGSYQAGSLDAVFARVLLKLFPKIVNITVYEDLVAYYRYSSNAQILYELGLAAETLRKQNDVEKYFKIAMSMGHRKAAVSFTKYVSKHDIRELEKLANLLIPEANFLVGIHYLESNRFAKGITFIKIAAAFEYLPAIETLSEREFENFARNKDRDKYDDEFLDKLFLNALKLNQYVVQKKPTNKMAKERLGKLYYLDNDFRKAEPLLKEVSTAEANFLCGKMYQYGGVFAKDLQKAKSYFEKSMQQGHRYASVEYDKVSGWIRSNQARESYSSSRSYSSSSYVSSSSSSSSLCFLTTATCVALGKEDNCEEIKAYKSYRDEHLRFDEDGRDLIVEYYRIAPFIVQQINEQQNANEIYVDMYKRYIKVGYSYLQSNDLKNAKATYIGMVKELCEKFNIVPFE
ncbi:MAG: CFI-box-CTERM domain-containing protein [Neobacillus sp.]